MAIARSDIVKSSCQRARMVSASGSSSRSLLIKRLRELDPDADAILALWQEDYTMSDRAIAKALGRPQRTFADQTKRIRTELRKVRGY